MKKLIFISVIFFAACHPATIKKPDDLISSGKMVEILSDIYLYQQAKNVPSAIEDPQSVDFAYLNSNILKNHDVTAKAFQESFAYYSLDPEDYKKMMDRVQHRLEKERDALKAKVDAENSDSE